MTLDQLKQLQSLAKQARQDFLTELLEGKYDDLEKSTGLSRQQIYRLRKGEGDILFETMLDAFIHLRNNAE
jgi:mRNA-degrading endonuclease RelE of RelBE toxin-antitoxin system